MENLSDVAAEKINKELWEDKAKIIYERLIHELNFSVKKDDEESLFKEINKNVSIGFDTNYFFKLVITENKVDERLRKAYLNILNKYASKDFIGDTIIENEIIGGYIKIDSLDDINIVFENTKNLKSIYWE
jgi:hypothetical protein